MSWTPDYFTTMRTAVQRGRAFDAGDTAGSEPVVILGAALARAVWPAADAVGRCVHIGDRDAPCATVVGVAADPRESRIGPEDVFHFYVPAAQRSAATGGVIALLLRVTGDPAPALAAVRSELHALAAAALRACAARLCHACPGAVLITLAKEPLLNVPAASAASADAAVPAPGLDRRFAALYGQSLALLTDLYELTMAYGYWKLGVADRHAVFHLAFREHPFNGGFTIACGLHSVIEYVQSLRFESSDLEYLATLTGNDDAPLFEPAFLDFLSGFRFTCDVDAVPEGTVVFPHEPLVRVRGPILQAQIIETPLLNLVNYQSLVATKSARICLAAKGEPVLEFGLRRAQGIDGGVSASRAAYVGGAAATSNLLAGKLFGIPVRGTHAHSWVMSFDSELEAFEGYAEALPNNCVFLVDTYDTVEGVHHAIEVARRLRARGHEMVGIRLDSGDLAWLSMQARALLDEAGFPDARILATNDLDEHIIHSLKEQGARISVWGVGTRLVTAYDQPALGGVYKLSAVADAEGDWQYRVKLSEQAAKISSPGVQQVRRWRQDDEFVADAIFDEALGMGDAPMIVDPLDATRRRTIDSGAAWEDLLVPIYRGGSLIYEAPTLESVRDRAQAQLAGFHAGVKRFVHPHQYPVGLERRLHELRTELILQARGFREP